MFDAPTIFLVIFTVSFVLTLLSFVLGVGHFSIGAHGLAHAHAQVPHGMHVGHAPTHVAAGHGAHVGHAATDHALAADEISPFNMATILAFLTWFGGAGYLLTAHLGVGTVLAIVLAAVVGLAGAAIIFTFMVRILLPGQTPYLSSDDYDMPGTIGRLAVGIRAGGTGELVYSKGGTRRVASARTEGGQPLERGAEVVVVRQEGSIAYVEPIDAFMEGAAPEGARR